MKSLVRLFNLKGRTALITGGAGHIGSAIAHALAENGAVIAISDVDQERAESLCKILTDKYSVEANVFLTDLEDEKSVRALPGNVVQKSGSLDILINCAALVGTSGLEGWAVPLEQQSATSWRRALEVNLTAPFILAQESAQFLSKNGHGSIINILSIYGISGPDERLYEGTTLGNPAAYGASKAGLMQLTRHLATTLAPLIRCNAITPGGVEREQAASFRDRYVARTPLRRMAAEEDFMGAAAFLASDASAYITGQNIIVDGGWTSW